MKKRKAVEAEEREEVAGASLFVGVGTLTLAIVTYAESHNVL